MNNSELEITLPIPVRILQRKGGEDGKVKILVPADPTKLKVWLATPEAKKRQSKGYNPYRLEWNGGAK